MIAGHTVTSPPLRHRLSAAPLCRRYTIEMPAPGARQRGLTQPTLLTKLALPKGCHLDPGVALPVHVRSHIARVRWCPSLRCVDTWMPPCIAHYPNTDIHTITWSRSFLELWSYFPNQEGDTFTAVELRRRQSRR
jgi:hypothetical protein